MVTVTEQAPTVATAAERHAHPVIGTTTALSVRGADIDPDGGSLTYTWARRRCPRRPPDLQVNGSNAAQNTTATFSAAGTYVFTVTITDPGGLSTTSSVNVTVNQTLTNVSVTGQPPATTASRPVRQSPGQSAGIRRGLDTISSSLAGRQRTLLPAAGSELTISGGISGAGALTMDARGQWFSRARTATRAAP